MYRIASLSVSIIPFRDIPPVDPALELHTALESLRPEDGFSLVELSIVLVILGLLVGGTLSGQSLIKAAELRSIATERDRYRSAIFAFKDKYFALPGDMNNATQFWGAAASCPGIISTASGGTCDGDGDGTLENNTGNAGQGNESLRFWQHMALAGMIEGTFSGTVNNAAFGTYTLKSGTNIPASRYPRGAWSIEYVGTIPVSNFNLTDGAYGNPFFFTARTLGGTTWGSDFALLKPEDAYNIDTKTDDGRPGMGATMTFEAAGSVSQLGGCSDKIDGAVTTTDGNYRLTNTQNACAFLFKTGV